MEHPLHILCFGDSLTEGYSQYGSKMTPYSRWMKETLTIELIGEYDVSVVTKGASGELVTQGFQRRMEVEYGRENQSDEPYDWVIFLGGTNDLGWGKSVGSIHEKLVQTTDIPLGQGARVLLMTVPECRVRSENLDSNRDQLNELIRNDQRQNVYVLDLYQKITYHSMQAEERHKIWDDGLHFSEAGYERMGKLVAERLLEIMNGSPAGANNAGGGDAEGHINQASDP